MSNRVMRQLKVVVVAALTALLVGGSGAIAASLITGKDIKNGSIAKKDLKKKVRKQLKKEGPQGEQGPQGPQGVQGPQGPAGADAEYQNPEWGLIARNTIGSGVADLRSGPYGDYGNQSEPPYGVGSLGIQVSDDALSGGTPQEKAAFGNQVDFVGDDVLAIDEVGFHVYQTGENASISATNLPNITLEIDPNLSGGGDDYSSMVWLPDDPGVVNQWSGYQDATATGGWFLTGAEGGVTGCTGGSPCSFADLMTALDDGANPPTILSVQVVKGRDNAWVGAVDGLRLGATIYDFEPFGVVETAAG